jgi:hypothetical protein
LENIIHLNEGSSREFVFESTKEENVGLCDILAVEWMSGSIESELRHLLEIGLGIMGFGIVHMEYGARYLICTLSSLKSGCKWIKNFLIKVCSIEWLTRREPVD